MTIVAKIITDAYRESNNLPKGQIPDAIDQDEGLTLFNRFLKEVYGNEEGDPYTPIYIGNNNIALSTAYNFSSVPADYFPPDNCRIFFNNNQAQTVNLNPFPEDGERFALNDSSGNFDLYPVTLRGNGNKIGGSLSTVLDVPGTIREYMYRMDLSNWVQINELSLTDTFPFPTEFETFFVTALAMRINPRGQQQTAPETIQAYRRGLNQFRARYSQTIEMRPEEALIRTSSIRGLGYQGYGPFRNPLQRFNVGYY